MILQSSHLYYVQNTTESGAVFSILCILLSLIKVSSSFRSFIDRFNVYLLCSVFSDFCKSRADGDIKSLVKIRMLLHNAIDHIID